MNDMRKILKSVLATACLAAVGTAMIPVQEAQAGMGTGNPPPPPPPPVKRSYRLYEGSTDSDLTGKGFPGITVYHTRSWVTGRDACSTSANGNFEYVVRSDQQGVVHRASMFGLTAGWGSGGCLNQGHGPSGSKLRVSKASTQDSSSAVCAGLPVPTDELGSLPLSQFGNGAWVAGDQVSSTPGAVLLLNQQLPTVPR